MSKTETKPINIMLSPVVTKLNKIQWLDPKSLTGSKNPRKSTTKEGMKELKDSMLANGILSPILAYSRKDKKDLIIISGHRRTRAAIEINQPQIPVIVVDAEDYQAAEAALVDNIQREDLEPIDEAEALATVRDNRKLSIKEVALRCGKSESYVYRRLRLLDLPDKGKKALRDGEINLGIAFILLRVQDKEMLKQAVGELLSDKWRIDEDTALGIVGSYTNRLKDAPFDITMTALWKKAGPCSSCPKRSATQNLLFDEAKKDDYCLDLKCWTNKVRVVGDIKKNALKDSGAKILKNPPKGSYTNPGGEVDLGYGSPIVDLEKACARDSKQRTWKQLIGKDLDPKDVTAFQQKDGRLRLFMEGTKAENRVKARGIKLARADGGRSTPLSKSEKASRALKAIKEKAKTTAKRDAIQRIREADKGDLVKHLKALFILLSTSVQATPLRIFAQKYKLKPVKESWGGKNYRSAVEKYLLGLRHGQAVRASVELLLIEAGGDIYGTQSSFHKTLKLFRIDLKKLTARTERNLRTEREKKDRARTQAKPKKKSKPRRSQPKKKK